MTTVLASASAQPLILYSSPAAQWLSRQIKQAKTRLETLERKIRRIEIPVGIMVDSTGGYSVGYETLERLWFCQNLTAEGGAENLVTSRSDDFESPFANIRARAFLELALCGKEILADLKTAIVTFDTSEAEYFHSVKFQYLSQLFTCLPVDPKIKLKILKEFRLAGKNSPCWEDTRHRIYRELAFLAVREGEERKTQDLFKKAIRERRFDRIFHRAIIDALLAMNNENTIELLLEMVTFTDVSDYVAPLVNYALDRMIIQNVTSKQKRLLGIPQLRDDIPSEFLATHPLPGEEPLDLRFTPHLEPFQERVIYKSEQPKPKLIKVVIDKVASFIQEHSDKVAICLALLKILEERRIFAQRETTESLKGLAGNSTISPLVRSRAQSILGRSCTGLKPTP